MHDRPPSQNFAGAVCPQITSEHADRRISYSPAQRTTFGVVAGPGSSYSSGLFCGPDPPRHHNVFEPAPGPIGRFIITDRTRNGGDCCALTTFHGKRAE